MASFSNQAREALDKVAVVPPLTAVEEKAVYNLTAGEIAEGVALGKVNRTLIGRPVPPVGRLHFHFNLLGR